MAERAELKVKMLLHGHEVPDDDRGPVEPPPVQLVEEGIVVPEEPSAGSAAWQRAVARGKAREAAKRSRRRPVG